MAGHNIKRVILTHEAGRDGFWLARFLVRRGGRAAARVSLVDRKTSRRIEMTQFARPMSAAGATIEPRIRINRPDDENTRCRVSSARGQPKDFSQLTQPPTTLSTSNVISLLQGRTEPFARRL